MSQKELDKIASILRWKQARSNLQQQLRASAWNVTPARKTTLQNTINTLQRRIKTERKGLSITALNSLHFTETFSK